MVMHIIKHQWRFHIALVFLAVGVAVPGCSESEDELPREPVSGSVTLDDQPLASGAIQFSPSGQGGSSGVPVQGGGAIEDGQFSIPRERGLVPGTYKVSISSAEKRDHTKPAMPGKASRLAKESIPKKYNAKTTLTAEIKKGGTSDLKFELHSN